MDQRVFASLVFFCRHRNTWTSRVSEQVKVFSRERQKFISCMKNQPQKNRDDPRIKRVKVFWRVKLLLSLDGSL